MLRFGKFGFVFSVLVMFTNAHSQVVNGYANVTAINTGTNTLTVNNVDEAADSFEDGEYIVIMQMQDNVIGTTTDVVGFGSLGSIASAGLYEIRQILSHTETAGLPATITLTSPIGATYNINANASVQIITFRQFGSPNFTTTSAMSAKKWNGTTGGVLAIYCPGTLTIGHKLDADFDGFLGAGPNAGGAAGCSGGANYRTTTQVNFADKGQGIFKRTTANQAAGMGRILNGGGGGNSHNGGGGGGGNFSAGGDGGPGWNGSAGGCSPSGGGLGGLSLQTSSSVGRVFMGGGGGAGEGNNNLSTDGGDGGGIILIKANEIVTTACVGVTISANGESIAFAGNDGGGGAGAGGTIVFEVNTWNVTAGCPLVVSANGGNGGTANTGNTHGGGGGGGQGVIYYSTALPSNVTNQTLNGIGGCSNNSNPCNNQAGSGSGLNNAGIQGPFTGPLPVELVDFYASLVSSSVNTSWTTMSEVNNDYFIVQRSVDYENWEDLEKIDGQGNSAEKTNYFYDDRAPHFGFSYYRLKQVDFDGQVEYSAVREIYNDGNGIFVYPNPTDGMVYIVAKNLEALEFNVFNALGQSITIQTSNSSGQLQLDFSNLENGVYYIITSSSSLRQTHKIILSR
ncbi:MAG: T9SS type A sorting domain-containing protein [Crocinitomicaceae bacterium]|nr:T9SS type A sorting domain-containing protein [Crocinitomicaceae bacterium]